MTRGYHHSTHVMVCKGCLIKAGEDPDKGTESCIAKSNKETCYFCEHIQPSSWFRHMHIHDLPPSLQKELFSTQK